MEYYTYAYLRKDKTPYYIGKGKNNRIEKRIKNDIKPPGDKSRVIFLKQNLTENEAFKHEKYMISLFGRKDLKTGILHNRTDGGQGCSGRTIPEETREKIKNKLLNKKWNEKRKKSLKKSMHTEKIRKKHIEGIRKYCECRYKIITPDGKEYIMLSTIKELEELLPISRASIKRMIYNKKESIKGWKIKRLDELDNPSKDN